MSVQFGIWNLTAKPFTREKLLRVDTTLLPHGPDGRGIYSDLHLTIVYRAFHTRSKSEETPQPYQSRSGLLVTWDGRLDNREELVRDTGEGLTNASSDVEIVAKALDRWQLNAFKKLTGDWCLSIWNSKDRSLILAKDPVGPRQLYYSAGTETIMWSTILDPLALFVENALHLCEEYIAGLLSQFPAAHLTPYLGIMAVPPASFVRLTSQKSVVRSYFRFDPVDQIRHGSDAEYEEDFRAVFREAVRRRLRSYTPILAELSGGVDSSAIVCVADDLLVGANASVPRLDTLSYYDNSEPNWNEKPFFTKVEQRRGRTGHHIDVAGRSPFSLSSDRFSASPFALHDHTQVDEQFATCIRSQNYRVILSGIGGDEILGGSPDPLPELRDLLVMRQWRQLATQLKLWALAQRLPWMHLLLQALRGFLPPRWSGLQRSWQTPTWLDARFMERNSDALTEYVPRVRAFSSLPSFQENLVTLDCLQRQLASTPMSCDPLYEKWYPFLDRDLLAFLFSIPREQTVRPGHRRSVMRRALRGIVPSEILERRRKAFVARAPLVAVSEQWPELLRLSRNMLSADLGIVQPQVFREQLAAARQGREVSIVALTRTIALENWLRCLQENHMPIISALSLRPSNHASTCRAQTAGPSNNPGKAVLS